MVLQEKPYLKQIQSCPELETKMFLLRELTWSGTIDYVGFTHKINGLAGRERFETFWHTDCGVSDEPKNIEAPLRNSKPVVRLGRKATDQAINLRAGLPKRGVVGLQGVGSQAEELRSYAVHLVFWEKPTTDPFWHTLYLGPFVPADFPELLSGAGGSCRAVEC